MRRSILICAALVTLVSVGLPPALLAKPAAPVGPWQDKVDPWVLDTGSAESTEFLVFLADQADVRGAASLKTKAERGEFVYRTLSEHAERTQRPLRRRLLELGVEYRPFWVANMIWVRGPAGRSCRRSPSVRTSRTSTPTRA